MERTVEVPGWPASDEVVERVASSVERGPGVVGSWSVAAPEPPAEPHVGPVHEVRGGWASSAEGGTDRIEGRFVVRFRATEAIGDPISWAERQGVALYAARAAGPRHHRARRGLLEDTWVVEGPPDLPQRLLRSQAVDLVEPVYRIHAAATPDDPYYPYQWNLSTLGVPESWVETRGRGVVVAILDTGVSIGPDGLNLVLDGYDFVDSDPDPADSGWHGTHVAGVVAQTTDNGTGAASVAPGAVILPVRVLGEDGGDTVALAEGIVWAVEEGADIINLSLGSSGESELVLEALELAEEEGVLVVAASGNDGEDDFVQFPASVSTVLAVGATRMDASIAPYSNQGESLDLVAPGGTLSDDEDGDGLPDGILQEAWVDGAWSYVVAEGTSVATPHVSGVAALVIGHGVETPAEVRDLLRETAQDLGDEGPDDAFGHGLLDPMAAVAAAVKATGGGESGGVDDDPLGGGSGGVLGSSEGETVSLGTQQGNALGCGG